MESIRELYRIGNGPSSSHTMAPKRAAIMFKQRNPEARSYRVTLFDSLAATGRGHMTDIALKDALIPVTVEIVWKPETSLPYHQNGMRFEALDISSRVMDTWEVFSLGGGALGDANNKSKSANVYDSRLLTEILLRCEQKGEALWEYVEAQEGEEIWDFLQEIWRSMREAIERGLTNEGVLPGGLGVSRKAWAFQRKTVTAGAHFDRPGYVSAYALAVAEENAAGGIVVTAPTCGSSGVVPAVLKYVQDNVKCNDASILRSLATAGLIGNLVKHNASISGAEVGCQGEIGTACAMAAGAAAQLLGGTVRQVEYAAEMGLEHHLGLTCDPVAGLVQIPCIERNAFAATQALTCADYSLFTDGGHRIPFDEVVAVMLETGNNLPPLYRETASGGLATAYLRRKKE